MIPAIYCEADFWGHLVKKSPPWSKLMNLIDLFTMDKLKFTALFEVNWTCGSSSEKIILVSVRAYLPLPHQTRVKMGG